LLFEKNKIPFQFICSYFAHMKNLLHGDIYFACWKKCLNLSRKMILNYSRAHVVMLSTSGFGLLLLLLLLLLYAEINQTLCILVNLTFLTVLYCQNNVFSNQLCMYYQIN